MKNLEYREENSGVIFRYTMKLNATPRHYMPLPQNQSDDDESGPSKEDKVDKQVFKNSFDASEGLSKRIRQSGTAEVNPKDLPMSPMRLTMFIVSLIICVLFIIIFVFFVPCTTSQNLNRICHLTYRWRKSFPNMSFTSPLDFLDHGSYGKRLIILGFEGSGSGLIAVQESNGKESWRLHLHALPISSFCNVIDVNSDGIAECLVIGNNGLFAAIDVKKGISLWYLHNHSDLSSANSIYGPVIIPDCNEDSIADIVVSYDMGSGCNSSYLALVSGGTGQIIGSLIDLNQCHGPAISQLSIERHNAIYLVLHCPGEINDNLWLLSSKNIYEAALNETDKPLLQNIFRIPHYNQDIQFYQIPGSKQELIIILDGIKIMLLKMNSEFNFQIVWKTHVNVNRHASEHYMQDSFKILTDGQFVNGSSQLVVAYTQTYQSKIIGLSLIDGKEVWSITHNNGTVTSAIKLRNFFGNVDGLLLKILSSVNVYESQIFDENNKSNSSYQETEKRALKNNLKSLKESYIFIKCGEIPVTKTITTEEVLTICNANGACDPNVYTSNSTVLVKAAPLGTSFDMLMVTSAILPSTNTEEMIIKYLNLENVLSFPRCTS